MLRHCTAHEHQYGYNVCTRGNHAGLHSHCSGRSRAWAQLLFCVVCGHRQPLAFLIDFLIVQGGRIRIIILRFHIAHLCLCLCMSKASCLKVYAVEKTLKTICFDIFLLLWPQIGPPSLLICIKGMFITDSLWLFQIIRNNKLFLVLFCYLTELKIFQLCSIKLDCHWTGLSQYVLSSLSILYFLSILNPVKYQLRIVWSLTPWYLYGIIPVM